jgi:hypothetical protein
MTDGMQAGTQDGVAPSGAGLTAADEGRALADAKRFRVVAIVAAVLFAPQVIGHIALPLTVVPTFRDMFASMGGALPWPTAFLVTMGPWLGVLLAVFDVLIFWGCLRLARRYWIGLLFAPLFTGGLITAPLIWALYMPMFDIITLVK